MLTAADIGGKRASEWHTQWTLFHDDVGFLFWDWIAPATVETFRGRDVLECGCGGGQHTDVMATVARSVTAVDLNTTDIARSRNRHHANVEFVEADLAAMDLGRQYDVVICIGVIHHTDDPDTTFANLYRHCKPGGTLIVWTYSAEGNLPVRCLVEPVRKLVLRFLPRRLVLGLSVVVTALLYPVVYSIYRLPGLRWLPYYAYFGNFRKLSFTRNVLNVFDKLNAPQTIFTTAAKCREWFSRERFQHDSIWITPYKGVSWSLVGTKALRASDRAA